MSTQELRDARGRTIGKIKQRSDGKLELSDANNRTLGTYDPRNNETRDSRNRTVGKGNLLTMLLTP